MLTLSKLNKGVEFLACKLIVTTMMDIESGWRQNELTEGVVKVEVGSLFQNFTVRIEKDDMLIAK